jgi:hypothetical protein
MRGSEAAKRIVGGKFDNSRSRLKQFQQAKRVVNRSRLWFHCHLNQQRQWEGLVRQ